MTDTRSTPPSESAAMGDSPCWPRRHDHNCESIEVDIGVGNMHSPCGCEIRWYQHELRCARSETGRNEIIEECAKVCDGRAEYWQEKVNEGSEVNGYETVELRQAAYAIRTLKYKETPHG